MIFFIPVLAQNRTVELEPYNQSKVSRLAAGVPTAQVAFTVDGGTRVRFHVLSTIDGISIDINCPNGQTVNSGNISGFNGTFNAYQIEPGQGVGISTSQEYWVGFHYVFDFPLQGTGSYTAQFGAPAGLNQEAAVITDVFNDSTVTAKLFTSSATVISGKPVVLSVALFDGQAVVAGASVTTEILLPDGTTVNKTFSDDGTGVDYQAGDGLYSSYYVPTLAGDYVVSAQISGSNASNIPFNFSTFVKFSVNPFIGRLTGEIDDYGVDEDSDGLFDKIVLKPEVETSQAGEFGVFVHLKTANDKYIIRNSRVQLANPGINNIEVDFEADAFVKSGENGPYTIELVELVKYGQESFIDLDSRRNLGQTQAYQISQLQRPPILFTNSNQFEGIDFNGNGKFDVLSIKAGVNVIRSGVYLIGGTLYDSNDQRIDGYYSRVSLTAGENYVPFIYNGGRINQNGVSGIFKLKNVFIREFIATDTSVFTGAAASATELLETPAYNINQFESAFEALAFTGNNSSAGIDNNSNGKYELLRVQVGFYSSVSGEFNIQASLKDAAGNFVQSVSVNQYVDTGINSLQFDFDGTYIVNAEIDGPLTIANVSVSGENLNLQTPVLFTTQPYNSNQFEADLEFAGGYSAVGIDTNADGKFNLLRVQGNIRANLAGSYYVSLSLYTADGNSITFASETFNFSTGVNTFTLDFRGNPIFLKGVNGPYRIAAFVSGQNRSLQKANLFETSAFNYTDFENTFGFVGTSSAEGIDTNGNGKFETLRITTNLLVETAGNYSISGSLLDGNGQLIQSKSSNGNFLSAGVNVVNFDFEGVRINNHDVDGPYTLGNVSVSAFDSLSVSNLFTTQAFTVNQFEAGESELQYVNYRIVPTTGDGDQIFEPGETAQMYVTLLNSQTGSAKNVAATLSSSSPAVEITSAGATYANITASSEKESSQFLIRLKPEAQYGTDVSFTLNAAFNGGQTKSFNFSIQTGKLNRLIYAKRVQPTRRQIFSMNSDGTDKANLSNNIAYDDINPVSSSNGEKIVFIRLIDSQTKELWIMNNDGSSQQRLTGVNRNYTFITPNWSPDSTKIVFFNRVNNLVDLYLINSDGTGLTQLTSDSGFEDFVSWSPDGAKLAYTKNGKIHVINANGTADTVIHDEDYQYDIKWSPDGVWLGWINGRDDTQSGEYYREIYVSKADGSEKRRVTDAVDARKMTWSPDGAKIAFIGVIASSNQRDIFSVNIADSQTVNLTNFLDNSNYNFEIDELLTGGVEWSADGKRISFAAFESFSSPTFYTRTSVFVFNVESGDATRLTEGTAGVIANSPRWERFDRIPPSSAISMTPSANSNGWNSSDATIGILAADNKNGSGVQSLSYTASGAQTINNTTVTGNSTTFSVFTEGVTTVSYSAKDNLNNTEDVKTYSVKIDKSAPISQHTASSDGLQTTFTLTASDTVSGVSEILYSIDGAAAQTYSAPFNVSNTGGHYVTYYAKDAAGNEEAPRTVYINPEQVPKSVLISEFRTRGYLGADDEFIELYNNSETPIDVSSWTISVKAGSASTPTVLATVNAGTILPARGHYLLRKAGTNNYSLSGYAEADQTYTGALADNSGIALFSGASVLIDAVGFSGVTDSSYREGTGLTPSAGIATSGQHSFVRNYTRGGLLTDSNNNRTDFIFVSTDAATYNNLKAVLGSPGPENLSSPIYKPGDVLINQIDSKVTLAEAPNRLYDYTAGTLQYPVGVLSVRRKLTNNTGGTINTLKVRITAITTKNSTVTFPQQAVLRLINSSDITVTSLDGLRTFPLKGLTIETVPTTTEGGMNSSLTFDLGATGLANGQSLNINIKSGIVTNGQYRLEFRIETLTAP